MKTKNNSPTFSPRLQKVTLVAGAVYVITQLAHSLWLLGRAYPGGSGFRISPLTMMAVSIILTPVILFALSYFCIVQKGSGQWRAFLAFICSILFFNVYTLCSTLFHTLQTSTPTLFASTGWLAMSLSMLVPLALTLILFACSIIPLRRLFTAQLSLTQQKIIALTTLIPIAISITINLWQTSTQYLVPYTLFNHLIGILAPIIFFAIALYGSWSRPWQHSLLVATIYSAVASIILSFVELFSAITYRLTSVQLTASPLTLYGLTLAIFVAFILFLKRK